MMKRMLMLFLGVLLLLGLVSCGGVYDDSTGVEHPEEMVEELFSIGGSVTLSLQVEGDASYEPYVIGDSWIADWLSEELNGYAWEASTPSPDVWANAPFAVSVSSSDASRSLSFFSEHSLVCCRKNGEERWYHLTARTEDSRDLAHAIRDHYDQCAIKTEGLSFSVEGSAEEAAGYFTETVYADHFLSQPPGGDYSVTDYDVLSQELREVSAAGDAVCAWFDFAVVPENDQSPGLWAGNTGEGTGVYEGWLTMSREFVLQKQDDGLWHCVGFGTGGYHIPAES